MATKVSAIAVCAFMTVVVPSVYAYGSGAPAIACENMTPGHRGQIPQTSAPPFAIRLGKTTYAPNERISVTLYSACNNEVFQGFLVQARAVGSTTPVGFFNLVPQTRAVSRCGTFGQAVTHTGQEEKSEITLEWVAPDQAVGDVVILATFLKNYQTFWVSIGSAVIRDGRGTGPVSSEYPTRTICDAPPQPTRPPRTLRPTTVTTTTTTSPAPTTQSILTPGDPAVTTSIPVVTRSTDKTISSSTIVSTIPEAPEAVCGQNKSCYSWCTPSDCRFNVTSEYRGNDVLIEMSAIVSGPDKWIALGLSRDTSMGDDSVVECVNTGGRIGVYLSHNMGYDNKRIGQTGISKEAGSVVDGVFRCSFRRKLVVESNSQVFDLRNATQWYLFLASGPIQGSEKLQHSNIPHISGAPVDLRKTGSTVQQGPMTTDRLTIVRAHGSLMLVAWIFATSLGIIVARYYKLLGGDATCSNDRYSFHIHRACMTITLVCVCISIIIIFVEVGGLSKVRQTGSLFLDAHPILGLVVVSLVLLNFSMGLLRPAPGRSVRPLYNWGHWATGTCAWIAAMATIFLGLAIPQARIHPSAKYVLLGFVGLHLLVQIFLELLSCHVDKAALDCPNKPMSGEHQLTTMDGQTGRAKGGFELQQNPVSGVGRLKAFILFTYVFLVFFLLFALIILVNTTV